jgi:hypothetical protein
MESGFGKPILLRGERLPHLQLPSAPAGEAVPLVAPGGRAFPVIVAVHGAECDGCRAYLRRLAAVEAEIREWDGRVLAIVPGGVEEAARLSIDPPLTVLADAAGGWARWMGKAGAAAVVADPWGEVRFRHRAGAAHDLPDPAELVDWARFIAIQCPECEGEAS